MTDAPYEKLEDCDDDEWIAAVEAARQNPSNGSEVTDETIAQQGDQVNSMMSGRADELQEPWRG